MRDWIRDDFTLALAELAGVLGRLEVLQSNPAEGLPDDALTAELSSCASVVQSNLGYTHVSAWYGQVARLVIAHGVYLNGRGGHGLTEWAGRLKRTTQQCLSGQSPADLTVNYDAFKEILDAPVRRIMTRILVDAKLIAPPRSGQFPWAEILDAQTIEQLDSEYPLSLPTEQGTLAAFKVLLDPDALNQIAGQAIFPVPGVVASALAEPIRVALTSFYGCGDDDLLPCLIIEGRRGKEVQRTADDLFAAEQCRLYIADLVGAASDGALNILKEAQNSGVADRAAIDALVATMFAVRHNYREAVQPLLSQSDVADTYGNKASDQLLRRILGILKGETVDLDSLVAGEKPDTKSMLSPLVALVLEAIQFNPFDRHGDVDLSAAGLNDPDRRKALIPEGVANLRQPITPSELVRQLSDALGGPGQFDRV